MKVDISWADLVGGRLSLDFLNTLGDRRTSSPEEHLHDYATLVAWAQHAGAVDASLARRLMHKAAGAPRAAAAVVADAIALREAFYRLVTTERAPHAADLARLNAELARASAEPHVVHRDGGYEVGWLESDELTAPLDAVVRDAVDLLIVPEDRARVRECESEGGCGWLFLDTTKGRTRRWCDMKICGNRAKARRHYARMKAESS